MKSNSIGFPFVRFKYIFCFHHFFVHLRTNYLQLLVAQILCTHLADLRIPLDFLKLSTLGGFFDLEGGVSAVILVNLETSSLLFTKVFVVTKHFSLVRKLQGKIG